MKKTMKRILAMLVAAPLMLCLVACGSDGEAPAEGGSTSAETVTFSMTSGSVTADSFHNLAVQEFADLVAERSNGTLVCEVVPGSSFGGEAVINEMMMLGDLEMVITSDIGMSNVVTGMSWAFLPMMISNREDADNIYRNGWISEELGKIMYDFGIVRLADADNGLRDLCTVSKKVETLSDFTGLKIRVPTLDSLVTFWEKVGAMPVTIASSEQVAALEQGMCDAVDNNPYGNVTNGVADYLHVYIKTGHQYASGCIAANADWFESLSPEHQAIIQECAEIVGQTFSDRTWEADENMIDEYVAEGKMEVVELDQATLDAMQEIAFEVWDEYADTFDPAIMEKLNAQFRS